MKPTHSLSTSSNTDSQTLIPSGPRFFSRACIGLLAFPLVAALGCAPVDDSGSTDDVAANEADTSDAIATGNAGARSWSKTVMRLDDSALPSNERGVERERELPLEQESGPSNKSVITGVSTGHGINYHNGSVMSGEVKAYYVFYGSWASGDKTVLNNFIQDFSGSPNYNINTLYGDSSGDNVANIVIPGGTAIDNYSLGTTLSDAGVFTVVKTAIANGSLPLDANGVYFVLTSSDVSESSGFCTEYCGWHDYGTYNNTTLKYSFVGNASSKCPSSCGVKSTSPNGAPGPDAMVSVIAHELEEATSDPLLNAWNDSRDYENADKCAWTFGTTFTSSNGATANMILKGHEYLVQQNWVNSGSGYCAVTYGQLSAHGGSGGSRFDVGCDAGDVAVGVVGRGGSLIDKIGLICAQVNPDGSLTSGTYTTSQYGGTGGSAFTKQCASGQAIVGLSGRSGSKLDQLTIKCSTLTNWESAGSIQSTTLVGGGGGGSAFDESCIQGHVLNRITGRSGSLVDQAQGGCARVWPY